MIVFKQEGRAIQHIWTVHPYSEATITFCLFYFSFNWKMTFFRVGWFTSSSRDSLHLSDAAHTYTPNLWNKTYFFHLVCDITRRRLTLWFSQINKACYFHLVFHSVHLASENEIICSPANIRFRSLGSRWAHSAFLDLMDFIYTPWSSIWVR